MRARLLLAVAWAGCASPPVPPNMSPGGPAVEVIQRDDGPIRLFWSPPRALAVEIRHADTGRLSWRASAGPTRLGPQADVLAAPLTVRPMGPPPDVHPPDGRGAEAGVPRIEAGQRYIVTVASCLPSGEGTPRPSCTPSDTLAITFEARQSSRAHRQ